MKSRILLFFTAFLIFCVPTASADRYFFDVPVYHPYYAAVKHLFEEGAIQGYEDLTFRPDQKVNRAEFLKMLFYSSGIIPSEEYAKSCFPDVEGQAWYARYVCYGKELGLIQGYPDGFFKPGNTINKVEALKIIAKLQDWQMSGSMMKQKVPFRDVSVDAWYFIYLQFAWNQALIDEVGESFEPSDLLRRGKIAEYISRSVIFRGTNYAPMSQEIVSAFREREVLTSSEKEAIIGHKFVPADMDFGIHVELDWLLDHTPEGHRIVGSMEDVLLSWANALADQGISRVSISPFTDDEFRFESLLRYLAEREVGVDIDLSDSLAHLSGGELQSTISEMHTRLKQLGISYRFVISALSFDQVTEFEKHFISSGVPYVCHNLRCHARGQQYLSDLDAGQSFPMFRDVMAGLALYHKKQTAIRFDGTDKSVNEILFQVVRSSPELLLLDLTAGQNDPKAVLQNWQLLREEIALWRARPTDTIKPFANIVLYLPFDTPNDNEKFYAAYRANLPSITDAIFAAGYDVKVTINEPIREADLYYVFGPAGLDTFYDLSSQLYQLRRVEQKAFFHPIGSLQNTVYWQKLFEKPFELRSQVTSMEDGENYLHLVREAMFGPLEEMVLSTVDAEHGTIALLMRHKNAFFVNGAHRIENLSQQLTNLMAPREIMRGAGGLRLVMNKNRSAVLAQEDIPIDLSLYGGNTIRQLDARGDLVETPTVYFGDNKLLGVLPKGHVVLITE